MKTKIDYLTELEDCIDKLQETKEWKRISELIRTELYHTNLLDSYPHIERKVDQLAVMTGDIYDLINGNPSRGYNKTSKIRKVLGYSIP